MYPGCVRPAAQLAENMVLMCGIMQDVSKYTLHLWLPLLGTTFFSSGIFLLYVQDKYICHMTVAVTIVGGT